MLQCTRFDPSAPFGEREDAPSKLGGKERAHFLDPRLEELGHRERLARFDAHVGGDARQACRIDLGLRDTDHVLVRHAHCEMARDLAQQPPAGLHALIRGAHRRQAVEVEPRIGDVLIGDEPPSAFENDVTGGRRHVSDDGAFEIDDR